MEDMSQGTIIGRIPPYAWPMPSRLVPHQGDARPLSIRQREQPLCASKSVQGAASKTRTCKSKRAQAKAQVAARAKATRNRHNARSSSLPKARRNQPPLLLFPFSSFLLPVIVFPCKIYYGLPRFIHRYFRPRLDRPGNRICPLQHFLSYQVCPGPVCHLSLLLHRLSNLLPRRICNRATRREPPGGGGGQGRTLLFVNLHSVSFRGRRNPSLVTLEVPDLARTDEHALCPFGSETQRNISWQF